VIPIVAVSNSTFTVESAAPLQMLLAKVVLLIESGVILNKLFVKWEDNPEFYFENVFASRVLTLSGAATCTQAESDLLLYSAFENDATRICIRRNGKSNPTCYRQNLKNVQVLNQL
jgi:hypothetical protein